MLKRLSRNWNHATQKKLHESNVSNVYSGLHEFKVPPNVLEDASIIQSSMPHDTYKSYLNYFNELY